MKTSWLETSIFISQVSSHMSQSLLWSNFFSLYFCVGCAISGILWFLFLQFLFCCSEKNPQFPFFFFFYRKGKWRQLIVRLKMSLFLAPVGARYECSILIPPGTWVFLELLQISSFSSTFYIFFCLMSPTSTLLYSFIGNFS